MEKLLVCILSLSMACAQAEVEDSRRRAPFLVPAPSSAPSKCGVDCDSFFSQDHFLDCLSEAFPFTNTLVLPGDAGYDDARMLSSIRTSPKPVAIVFARSASDVVAAVRCGFKADVRVSVANGRHSYQGLTIIDGYLAVDTSNLTKLEVVTDPVLSAVVGPGVTNTLFATGLREKAPAKDVFGVIGQCPSVGFGGYALGGGMALTSRSHGLACDNVLSLEMVLFNGTVIVANATHHSDMLWASCGGGGGLGVATEFTVKLHRQPSSTFTYFYVTAQSNLVAGKVDFQLKLQKWWSGHDSRLAGGSAGWNGSAALGIFWGTVEEARLSMHNAGLLEGPNQSITPPECVQCGEYTNYNEAFLRESCALWVGAGLGSIFPGRNTSDCLDLNFLHGDFARMSSLPQSPISMGASSLWQTWRMSTCRLLDPPSRETWEQLLGKTNPDCIALMDNTSRYNELLAQGDVFASRCFAVDSGMITPNVNHLLGGVVAERHPQETAFYYRTKYSPICFDASLPPEMVRRNGRLLDTFRMSGFIVRPQSLADGILQEITNRLDGVYSLLGPLDASVSYLNYQTPPLANWKNAYFGKNAERLARIKQEYDPLGVFSKPLIVEGASSFASKANEECVYSRIIFLAPLFAATALQTLQD